MKTHTTDRLGQFRKSVRRLFAAGAGRGRRPITRPAVERLEGRDLPAASFFAPAEPSGSVTVQLVPLANVTAGTPEIVTFGVPLTRGSVSLSQLSQVRVLRNGVEIPAFVEQLTPWRSIDNASIDGQSVRVARIQVPYTFTALSPEAITVQWGGPARTLNRTTMQDPRLEWHTVTSGTYVAADNVEEPDVLPVLPRDYLSRGMLDARTQPTAASVAEARDDPAVTDAMTFTGYTEYDYAQKNFFYTTLNQNPGITVSYKTQAEPWLYDRGSAMYGLYLRSGFATALREAVRNTDFYADRLNTSGFFTLSAGDPKYAYNEALAYTYWLLGDNRMLAPISTVVNAHSDTASRWSPSLNFWTERNAGYKLLANEIAYEVTGGATFKANVQTIVNDLIWHQNGAGGQLSANRIDGGLYHTGGQHDASEVGDPNVIIASSWMSALVVDPMVRAYGVWENAQIADFVVRMGTFEKAASKTDANGDFGGTLRYPDYLMRADGTSENRTSGDVQHAMDVGAVAAWAAYFAELRGTPDASLRQLANDLYATYDVGVNFWTRPGGTNYNVSPPRRYTWEYKNSGSFSWALTGTDAAGQPGALQFNASSYSVAESGGALTVTVTRAGGTSGAVSVQYATSTGSATAGSDYTAASGTLNWADGDGAPKTFTVPITNDTAVEGNETVNLALTTPTGGATLGTPATATLTITDDDAPADTTAPTVNLSSPTGGTSVSGLVTVSASAADNVGVVGVQFLLDGQPLGAEDTSAPYSVSWNSSAAANGSHALTARARDAAGNTATAVAATVMVSNSSTPEVYQGLTIPRTHTRLWFTPERLTQARQYYATHPFTPSSSDPQGNALRYLMTGEASYAQVAITALMNFTVSAGQLAGVASDTYRWEDWVPLVFDWCYDQMTESQRSTFMARYNGYVDVIRQKPWGGPGMEANNYYWGYLRNEFNWAVATYYENTAQARVFLDHALNTRWRESFLPWAASATGGRGGVAQEGSNYGWTMFSYPLVPLATAGLLGRDLWGETNYYKEAAYYLMYATSPGPVANKAGTASFYQVFPFNEDERSVGFPPANNINYVDYMVLLAERFEGTPLGGHARQWLAMVGGSASWKVAASDTGGPARPLGELPLDYYAAGPSYLYARSAWAPTASSVNVQMGVANAVGHEHKDAGSFQMLRNGRWVTRETTGYATTIVGPGGAGTTEVNTALGHNTLLVAGRADVGGWRISPPQVTRLESQPAYTFASVNLTNTYRASRVEVDNPAVGSAARDFVYVRGLDTLLVFDRVASAGAGAAGVAKTFLLHFQNPPTVQGNTVLGVTGDQALRLTTLVPAGQSAPSYQVVNERPASGAVFDTDYQYRLEATTSGQVQSYLINVLQARDASGADVTATMTEDATSFTITLSHPTRGTAVVRLSKGMASSGGEFGYAASGVPASLTPLTSSVQQMQVTDNGPVWQSGAPTPGTFQFSGASYAVGEGGGSATVTVTRAAGSSGAVTVQYATSNGSATAGSDYTAASGTLSWASGDTAPKTFTIPIANDTAVEGSETINLTLTAPGGGASLGSPVTATLTITDDDVAPPGTFQFGSATYSVAEGGGGATITVTRAGGSGGAVTVQYATSNGTATAGSDYTAASGTLSWANGDTAPKTFTVPIANDTAVEASETINLMLTTPGGGAALGAPATATLTITDDDIPKVAAVTVDSGSAQRSVVRSLTVVFDGVVTIGANAFSLTRTGGPNIAVAATAIVAGGRSVATLTFSGTGTEFGSLADGNYTLTVVGSQITDSYGRSLDGDGDGTAGGNRVETFHRLYGDADGNRTVDALDLFRLYGTFGKPPTDPGYLTYFDFDGNGAVDTLDLFRFYPRFGTTISQ